MLLVAVVVTGFLAGRTSTSTVVGLLAVLTACALVVGGVVIDDPRDDGDASAIAGWLVFAALAFGAMLPGFAIGRVRRNRSAVARLVAQRDAGSITAEAFEQDASRLGWFSPSEQAPPGHRCGRCGKPLSPVWRNKCLHCGATYAEIPPVPKEPTTG